MPVENPHLAQEVMNQGPAILEDTLPSRWLSATELGKGHRRGTGDPLPSDDG